jgi:hypothetical protein
MSEMLFRTCKEGDFGVLLLDRVRRRFFFDSVTRFQRGRLRRFFLLNRGFGA